MFMKTDVEFEMPKPLPLCDETIFCGKLFFSLKSKIGDFSLLFRWFCLSKSREDRERGREAENGREVFFFFLGFQSQQTENLSRCCLLESSKKFVRERKRGRGREREKAVGSEWAMLGSERETERYRESFSPLLLLLLLRLLLLFRE
jgi:hypothetical protein